jgi:hypothetical protein
VRIHDLFETAETDLWTQRYAQRAVTKIGAYLSKKNEHVPLKDCGFLHTSGSTDDIWMFPVTDAGLPHRDLWFGVGWRRNGDRQTRAFASTGRNSTGRFRILVMLLDHDPSNDVDVTFMFKWDHLIHEMTHILDYQRGLLNHKDNVVRAASIRGETPRKPALDEYYNSPAEYNAYYQQGLYSILNTLNRDDIRGSEVFQYAFKRDTLDSFANFRSNFMHEFDDTWMHYLTPANKRRFTRRFYKLYQLVRQEWPNMEAIRDMEAERQEIDARLDAEEREAA